MTSFIPYIQRLLAIMAAAVFLTACGTTNQGGAGSATETDETSVVVGEDGATSVGAASGDDSLVMEQSAIDLEAVEVWSREDLEASKVFFDFDRWNVSSMYDYVLIQQAAFLMQNPELSLVIGAHADERGSQAYNLSLSEKRGSAVREILVEKGIDAARIEVIGYGESLPMDDRHTVEAWDANRRAEFSYE